MEGVGQVALVGKDKGRDLMRNPSSYKASQETRLRESPPCQMYAWGTWRGIASK